MNRISQLETDGDKSVIGVSSVFLEGFRNYSELFLEISPGFNIISGPNAQGKTNLLEALYLLSTTRLLRGQRDAEAIQKGRTKSSISLQTLENDSKLGMVLEMGIRKRAFLNGLGLPRAADIIGRLPTVCISSADMEIVRGEPSDRRLFLDLELSGLFPSYLRHLSVFKRALEQRNALLRESRDRFVSEALYEPWEAQIAHHGSALRSARAEYIDRLSPIAHGLHRLMADGEELSITYVVKDDAIEEEQMAQGLASSRSHDIARGGTSVGPHRDDLNIEVDGKEARLYGSQGQQRTAVISLKMSTLVHGKSELGFAPLLLLDDILSDLDENRRERLVDMVLGNAGQAVLTCTEATAAGQKILDLAKVFTVHSGRIEQV
jgi:DNA replication and repair protein RecF